MRKLASIQRVKSLEDIYRRGERADNIVVVKFNDVAWQCVGKRTDFSVGDLCVYVEVSTVLPEHPVFSFMEKVGHRVKTVKMWGQLSQGLPLPLSILNEFDPELKLNYLQVGDDVSEIIGVKRLEDFFPPKLGGEQAGIFPTHLIAKTDEDRIQSYPNLLNDLVGKHVVATYKMDGTSCTVLKSPDGELLVCSRNYVMKEGENVYWRVTKQVGLDKILDNPNFSHLQFQGEIVGSGIQGNPLDIVGHDMYIFNLVDGNTRKPFGIFEIEKFCSENGLKFAKPFKIWNEFDVTNVQELIGMLEGECYPFTNSVLEGVVIRPVEPFFSVELGKWFSFKVINNDYLLKKGE